MKKKFHFPNWLLVLCALLFLIPAVSPAADRDRLLLENWTEKERFSDITIEERLELLEKLARQDNGDRIFCASMACYKEKYQLIIKEIDARMDLKTLLDSFHLNELKFCTSDKISIKSSMVFRQCSLISVIEQLCLRYQLKTFYHESRLYFIPAPRRNSP